MNPYFKCLRLLESNRNRERLLYVELLNIWRDWDFSDEEVRDIDLYEVEKYILVTVRSTNLVNPKTIFVYLFY